MNSFTLSKTRNDNALGLEIGVFQLQDLQKEVSRLDGANLRYNGTSSHLQNHIVEKEMENEQLLQLVQVCLYQTLLHLIVVLFLAKGVHLTQNYFHFWWFLS